MFNLSMWRLNISLLLNAKNRQEGLEGEGWDFQNFLINGGSGREESLQYVSKE